MAKDVARLYSWANVDDAPYRDFFRKKPQKQPQVPDEPTPEAPGTSEPGKIEIAAESATATQAEIETQVAAQVEAVIEAAKPPLQAPIAEKLPVFDKPPLPPHPMVASLPAASQVQAPVQRPAKEVERPSFIEPVLREPAIESGYRILTGEPQFDHPERRIRLASEPHEFQPAMAIYSLAGGVGKTTLCANLGRALYLNDDRVLLVDASGCGLLPFYFGANNLQPGLHTFSDPDRDPLRVISGDAITSDWLVEEVRTEMDSTYWTIFDLGAASTNLLPQILALCSFVLIPLLPDLNSILSVSRIESLFEQMRLRGASVPSPFYLFNKFDPEDPIDKGARELVLRQCGGRLLPWSIRHDSEAARAIASRKTVIDHAPDAELANASVKLAALLQQTLAGNRTPRSGRRWNDV